MNVGLVVPCLNGEGTSRVWYYPFSPIRVSSVFFTRGAVNVITNLWPVAFASGAKLAGCKVRIRAS
jgi:hypothetical protein